MPERSYLVGLIGAGIGTSLSPALHEREAARHRLTYAYRILDLDRLGLAAEAVGDLLRRARDLGYHGLNITHPCKQLVIEHLDALSPDAATLRAVNTVVFTDRGAVGHNTDLTGFTESFARGLPDVPTRHVVQLGAGGAGAATAHALLALGARHLTVVDAEHTRATALARALTTRFGHGRATAATLPEAGERLRDADGLVHATPTGMARHPGLPLPEHLLRPALWVADIVYRPLRTPLLRAAERLGCRTLHGGGMAVFQAAEAFRLFTGREPHADHMLADLADLVGATT
ncbi:shikimate dehydrogenase [Streptomyces millisiae]|uniref:Shikimate dehydrogenase n=1 Tax=Streptomyces millisiae TaxID=3075542 RepID=A0ABU2LKL2_9ACTN|nr:shikimate dehydrogenase [Streptomyces sp. DSM 44918]MDT0317793.1 shikimate dehydrogenase [Streptomyces sp. DSM 44918]